MKIFVEIDVPYHPYPTKQLNRKADSYIKRWIKELLVNEASFIPLMVEKDKSGAWIDDCSNKTRIKVK